MSFLQRLFGARPASLPPESRGTDVIRYLQPAPIVRSWARGQTGSLEALWTACPRIDWLADIALHAGVPVGRVAEVLDAILDGFEPSGRDDLAAALGEFLDDLVDSDHEVQFARALEAYNVDANRSLLRIFDEAPDARAMVDDLELGFHLALADRFRAELPYEILRAALYADSTNGPYR